MIKAGVLGSALMVKMFVMASLRSGVKLISPAGSAGSTLSFSKLGVNPLALSRVEGAIVACKEARFSFSMVKGMTTVVPFTLVSLAE